MASSSEGDIGIPILVMNEVLVHQSDLVCHSGVRQTEAILGRDCG